MEEKTLSGWLKEKCQKEHLSMRQAGERTGISHSTVDSIIRGGHASADTVAKLARGFSSNGGQRQALEDHLLALAGYRTEQPEEKLSEPLAQLMTKLQKFDESGLEVVRRFADFLIEIVDGNS